MAYHIQDQIYRYSGIKKFSGQGVEKNNDLARKHYLSSNHHDAPKEVIHTEARIEQLSGSKREKRSYQKVNMHYWKTEILQKRQRLQIAPNNAQDTSDIVSDSL